MDIINIIFWVATGCVLIISLSALFFFFVVRPFFSGEDVTWSDGFDPEDIINSSENKK